VQDYKRALIRFDNNSGFFHATLGEEQYPVVGIVYPDTNEVLMIPMYVMEPLIQMYMNHMKMQQMAKGGMN